MTGTAARYGRRALVVAQVALAVTTVAAAGLLARSLLRLQSVDLGIAADRLVFVNLALPPATADDRARHARFLDEVIARLRATPGVAAATAINAQPFALGWNVPSFTADGQSRERAADNPSLALESVHPTYFSTFDIPILRGRAFTDDDRLGTIEVAIVSEDVAARTWPGQDPIGKRLKMGEPDSNDPWRTVVGVAAPTRYRDLARPHATLYLPAAQFLVTAQTLALRTSAPPDRVATLAHDIVHAIDPAVSVMRVAPFQTMFEAPLARPRFNAWLLGIFGGAALLLATVGLYAVMAAFVRQRDREIGIRMALGATPARVRRLVMREGLSLAGLGALIGLAGAAVSARFLRGLLFDIHPLDPGTLVAAAIVLMAAALLASYGPVRRAARLDPVAMLRRD